MEGNLALFVEQFDAVSAMWTRAKSGSAQLESNPGVALDLAVDDWTQWTDGFLRTVRESAVDPATLIETSAGDHPNSEVDWNLFVDRKVVELAQDEDVSGSDEGALDGLLRVWEAEALVRCGMSPSRAWEFAGFLPSLKQTRRMDTRGVIGPLGAVMADSMGRVRQWMEERELRTWQALIRVLGASRVIAAAAVLVEADAFISDSWNHPISGLSQVMGELKAAAEASGLDSIEG